MAGKNLFEEFHADEVEEMELEAIFSGHFGGSMSLSLDEVAYPGHKTQHALKLRYGKKGLSEITAGPMLDAETVKTLKAQIESELLASSELRVAREILFAGVPVEGYFRYRDYFKFSQYHRRRHDRNLSGLSTTPLCWNFVFLPVQILVFVFSGVLFEGESLSFSRRGFWNFYAVCLVEPPVVTGCYQRRTWRRGKNGEVPTSKRCIPGLVVRVNLGILR